MRRLRLLAAFWHLALLQQVQPVFVGSITNIGKSYHISIVSTDSLSTVFARICRLDYRAKDAATTALRSAGLGVAKSPAIQRSGLLRTYIAYTTAHGGGDRVKLGHLKRSRPSSAKRDELTRERSREERSPLLDNGPRTYGRS